MNTSCKLLGSVFSYLIQIFLGLVAISSLLYKRHIEKPQRSWEIWFYDVTKQLFGGFLVHCLNILVSKLLKGKGDLKIAILGFLALVDGKPLRCKCLSTFTL